MAYTPKNESTTAKTSDYQLKVTDVGQSFSNEGANDLVAFTLPPVQTSLQFRFIVQSESGLRIKAQSGERIRVSVLLTNDGGWITAMSKGASVLLKGTADGEWTALSFIGAWNDQ